MRKLICWFLGHHLGVTIKHGWAITRCQRCHVVVDAERVKEGAR